jgi:hypothetical protein
MDILLANQALRSHSSLSCQITKVAGDNSTLMPCLHQMTGQFIVTGATGLIRGDKSLMNQQDMHLEILKISMAR